MRTAEKTLQHRQIEEPVPLLDPRHFWNKLSTTPAVGVGHGDAQPVSREKAEETPEPKAGVGAALFETRGNDETTDEQEEQNARPAKVAAAQESSQKVGQGRIQPMFGQNHERRQAACGVKKTEPLLGRGGAGHDTFPRTRILRVGMG